MSNINFLIYFFTLHKSFRSVPAFGWWFCLCSSFNVISTFFSSLSISMHERILCRSQIKRIYISQLRRSYKEKFIYRQFEKRTWKKNSTPDDFQVKYDRAIMSAITSSITTERSTYVCLSRFRFPSRHKICLRWI